MAKEVMADSDAGGDRSMMLFIAMAAITRVPINTVRDRISRMIIR